MKNLILSLALGIGLSLSALAGGYRIIQPIRPDYSAIDDLLEAQAEAQYEAQIQAQLDQMAARQQYLEELAAREEQYLEELYQNSDY